MPSVRSVEGETSSPVGSPGVGPGSGLAATAGVAGAGLAVGLAELAAGVLTGMPSLLDAVAGQVVAVLPGGLVTWGIETFGQADRAVIRVTIAVVVLGIGAFAGLARRRRTGSDAWLFGGFALVGAAMALADINAQAVVVIIVTAVATVAGWWAMTWLVAAASWGTPSQRPNRTATQADRTGSASSNGPVMSLPDAGATPGMARRRFLARTLAVGGAAAVAAVAGRRLGGRARGSGLASGTGGGSATDPAALTLPSPGSPLPPPTEAASFDVAGLAPLFVPNDEFYRIDTAVSGPPMVDVDAWELRLHGLVRDEVVLTYQDLLDRDLVEADITISCVSNEVGDDLIGNARWTGVALAQLLDEAGVADGGTQVVGRAVDGFTVGFPTEVAMDGRDALVAVGMNGQPLPVEHGFPARLIVPGLYGYVSATKWLSDIELVGWDDFDGYWVPGGWAKRGPIKTQSRIDTVVDDVDGSGKVAAGVAWAQPRGVSRVEVQVDDAEFVEAELAAALNDVTWVQWRAPLDVASGSHSLTVRATDRDGVTQPQARTPPHPDGADGWHRVIFDA